MSKSISPPSGAPVHLAWIQTRMALERTLLAWVRTGAALIGFGFAIFNFFEALNRTPGAAPARMHGSAKLLGISLAAIGTLAMVLALVQYVILVRYLENDAFRGAAEFASVPRLRPGLIVALVLTAVGVITLWVLIMRLPP
jgi:putative membrane protein